MCEGGRCFRTFASSTHTAPVGSLSRHPGRGSRGVRVCSKYNEDNKMHFMTTNLIRGWFQRMEHMRQYALGVALMIGEERRHEIVALCVLRGQGMPAVARDVEGTELLD
ncbi:elongation factor 1-gamma (EF-1-gamma), putative [Trypanosoma cruzi]|uniref:Elongation factor 1-gamma (EF-1-gamma), putative n=1 Tax=Trypanosoma cruzi (strain CL Brener) TaxID=353153 RepID=Q4E5U8_TRYCC|nr:elongation factor 1-gamma (EF-1-gamma), putative [Trypanosoma cruzi]EAO00165.1 elongation factor 1-gamma (EF-1-gamma), putative [Trypanosoma cruzi]|eukprot:XP_822016.1 elongation factor 1-gamma (EF-1-gamma) [Trypanosoma cruzi strain CL Brener]